MRGAQTAEQTVLRADNWGWGAGYEASDKSGGQVDWATWLAAMNGAQVTAYFTNCGNGTVDAQFIMVGTDGKIWVNIFFDDTGEMFFASAMQGGESTSITESATGIKIPALKITFTNRDLLFIQDTADPYQFSIAW